MIAAKPTHGYDLIKGLEDRMGGGYSPSPGVIYPTLTMLEEQGYASLTAEGGKKLYQATQEGEAFLKANQAAVEAIQSRINTIARERSVVAGPAYHPGDREPEDRSAPPPGRRANAGRAGPRHRCRHRRRGVGGRTARRESHLTEKRQSQTDRGSSHDTSAKASNALSG